MAKSEIPTILAANFEADIFQQLRSFAQNQRYDLLEANSLEEAKTIKDENRPLLALVGDSTEYTGLDFIQRIHGLKENTLPFMLLTERSDAALIIAAFGSGAYDFIKLPFNEEVLVSRVNDFLTERDESRLLYSLDLNKDFSSTVIIGDTPLMHKLYRDIGRYASQEINILVTGETGTGKELVATLLHSHSYRRMGALQKVSLPALSANLIESELFGHEKGAFTGALTQRKGRFELANKGTLFLDEVGELPLTLQAKLLRVLQEGEFERVGGSTTIKVDTRVVSATNQNLAAEVAQDKFREDLFYRLAGAVIHTPPLREHPEDIPMLTEFFLKKYSFNDKPIAEGVSQPAMDQLMNYNWPGNVRQLQHSVRRAAAHALGRVILTKHLDADIKAEP